MLMPLLLLLLFGFRYLPPSGPIDWTLNGIEGYNYPDLEQFCGDAAQTAVLDILTKLHHDDQNMTASSSGSSDRTNNKAGLVGKDSITFRVVDYQKSVAAVRGYLSKGLLQKLDQYRFVTVHTNEWQSRACKDCPALADPAPAPTWNDDGSRAVNNSAACLYRHLFGIR
jgi:hypothetical protein